MTDTKNTPNGLSFGLASVPDGVRDLGLDTATANPGTGVGSFAVGAGDTPPGARVSDLGPFVLGVAAAAADGAFDEALAFALFVETRDGSNGTDILAGFGEVDGTTQAEIRGVSVGKDIAGDPDFLESDAGGDEETDEEEDFGPGVEDFIPAVLGEVELGDGTDLVQGVTTLEVDAGDEEPIFYANTAVIIDEDSVLRLGDGDDLVVGISRTTVRGPAVDGGDDRDGDSQPDPDTEAIVDGIENVGLLDAGDGDDRFVARLSATSESGTALVGSGIDNGSFGNLNQAFDDVKGGARFLAGDGDDVVDIEASLSNVGEGSILDGWSNLSIIDLGDGDDRVTITSRNTFIDTPDVVGQQEEVITDGLDNRATFVMGAGDDTLRADVEGTGNGVLTNAAAIDSRGDPNINGGIGIDAGAGDDLLHGRVVGRVTAPVAGDENAGQATPKTLINGYLLESGGGVSRNFMRDGDDTIDVKAEAFGRATDTAAIGMNAISINIPATDRRTFTDLGDGDDTVIAVGRGEGSGKVAAYGLNGGELVAGDGDDTITGEGHVRAGAKVEATGIRLDDDFTLFGGTGEAESTILSKEGAVLATGDGHDTVTGIARLGAGVDAGDAVGIRLGEAGRLTTGDGDDTVVGRAESDAGKGRADAIAGDAAGLLDTGEGDDVVDAEEGWFAGGFTLRLGDGDDLVRGFGDVVIDGGRGHDTLEIDFSLHHLASVGGTVRRDAGDDGVVLKKLHWRLEAEGIETFAFTDGDVAADHLETAFDALVA
jgi:hypothetical protein